MKALFEAIAERFSGSALDTALDGQLFAGRAPQGTELPYGSYIQVSDVPSYTFDTTHERVTLQFDLYAREKGQAADLYEVLKAVFDDCRLNVSGYEFGKMERIFAQEIQEKHCWRWIVQHVVKLEKTRS